MGWFSRVIINAVEPGDECFYGTERKGTVHGSRHKKELSRLGQRAMDRDKKPDGFIRKASRRP